MREIRVEELTNLENFGYDWQKELPEGSDEIMPFIEAWEKAVDPTQFFLYEERIEEVRGLKAYYPQRLTFMDRKGMHSIYAKLPILNKFDIKLDYDPIDNVGVDVSVIVAMTMEEYQALPTNGFVGYAWYTPAGQVPYFVEIRKEMINYIFDPEYCFDYNSWNREEKKTPVSKWPHSCNELGYVKGW